jgi:indole-3-glycerol phosphate synthase
MLIEQRRNGDNMNILQQIIAHKKFEISQQKARSEELDLSNLPPIRDFAAALRVDSIALIAELKHQSPSSGILREKYNLLQIAGIYQEGGAAAISVLTDQKYFGGRGEHIVMVREAVSLPILRKDFILDPCQIAEARSLGADAVLLIAAILGPAELGSFLRHARELDLSCLVEAHTQGDVEKAVEAGADIIGINNRDLSTMEVDVTTSLRLRELIPPGVIAVSESGIRTREDVLRLEQAGFDALLVGSVLMSSADVAGAMRELLGT